MCPDILNILSTDAEEAGTPKNFLARGANVGNKYYSYVFQNNNGSL
jgi:hypothetical protein